MSHAGLVPCRLGCSLPLADVVGTRALPAPISETWTTLWYLDSSPGIHWCYSWMGCFPSEQQVPMVDQSNVSKVSCSTTAPKCRDQANKLMPRHTHGAHTISHYQLPNACNLKRMYNCTCKLKVFSNCDCYMYFVPKAHTPITDIMF